MRRIFFLLLVSVMLVSCEKKISLEDINKLESQLFDKNNALNKESAVELVEAYMLFAKQNPDNEQAPDLIFKALDISVNLNTNNPNVSVGIADVLVDNYPDFEMSPMALYIKGFIYETQMNDIDGAEKVYNDFLAKYPDSPMADEVKVAIQNLNIPLDELIKSFENANE